MEEKDNLEKLSPLNRQAMFDYFVRTAFTKYKSLFFGDKIDILPPDVMSTEEMIIRSNTDTQLEDIQP